MLKQKSSEAKSWHILLSRIVSMVQETSQADKRGSEKKEEVHYEV